MRSKVPDEIVPGDSNLGKWIRDLREAHGMGQKTVAKDMQINRGRLSELENGKRMPSLGELNRFYRAVGLTPIEWKQLIRMYLVAARSSLLASLKTNIMAIQRYYYGIKRRTSVPIVVTSAEHPTENYVTYPACDIHVAQQVSQDLKTIGVTSKILPDQVALRNPEQFLQGNLVLICSPFGNKFTQYVVEHARAMNYSIGQEFGGQQDGARSLSHNGREFHSENARVKTQEPRAEYALIARYINPWSPNHRIFIFAGLNAIGTHAIGDFLMVTKNYEQLTPQSKGTEDLVAVLKLTYVQEDACTFNITLSPAEVF